MFETEENLKRISCYNTRQPLKMCIWRGLKSIQETTLWFKPLETKSVAGTPAGSQQWGDTSDQLRWPPEMGTGPMDSVKQSSADPKCFRDKELDQPPAFQAAQRIGAAG